MNMQHDDGSTGTAHGAAHGSTPSQTELPPNDAAPGVTVAEDLDPAEGVVSVKLEAKPADIELAPGHEVRMWTYNGSFPGPRIEANVGDRVRVQFTNSLSESTTIHWHGLRVPAAMDGVPAVQREIPPGGTFTYEFVVPDAGTFWYHPHVRSDVQIERGLYGAIVVHSPNEPKIDRDEVVMLDDILLDDDWQVAAARGMMEAMIGREGNLLLANGRANPVLEVASSGLTRFRFVNTANAHFFRMRLPGHELVQIGADGALFERAAKVDEVLIVPGQRVDVLAIPKGQEGDLAAWQTHPYARGHGTDGGPTRDVFQLRIAGAVSTPQAMPDELGVAVAALPEPSVERELRLEERMMGGGGGCGHKMGNMGPMFSINGEQYPDVTPLKAKLGTVEEWSLVNTTEMDHPFHLHGFRFQVVQGAGVEPTRRAWRDTIDIPANATIKIRMKLEEHPGSWMFHCHILEHAELGMMGELAVEK